MSAQKKEEEKKILAEMDAAMSEKAKTEEVAPSNAAPQKKGAFADKTPKVLHCRQCRTEMKEGVCPACGFRMYVPMDENKQKNIRFILGGICLVAFVVLLLLMK